MRRPLQGVRFIPTGSKVAWYDSEDGDVREQRLARGYVVELAPSNTEARQWRQVCASLDYVTEKKWQTYGRSRLPKSKAVADD